MTTMWLGAAGIFARRLLSPEESARHLDWIRQLAWLDPESGEAFRHLGFFLSAGRTVVVLVNTLVLGVLGLMVSRLFDRLTALVGVSLLALEPYLIGHSGLLHTDALLANLMLLTLVASLTGLREPRRTVWWPLAGLCAGLALLTKSPALILFAFVPLMLAVRYVLSFAGILQEPARLSRLILCCTLFLATAAVTFYALHPGMWNDPAGTAETAFSLAGRHATSVQRPIFFAGRMMMDPGPAFYPLVLLFRASPLALIGVIAGLIFLRHVPPDRRFAFLALLCFVVLFTAGMSLGTKKHARYLLPVFPPLSVAAAAGAGGLLSWYTGRSLRTPRSSLCPAALLFILPQAVIALAFAAYPLTYQNPLLGGPAIASKVLATGWGEGLGAAALRLNRLPGADGLTVAASSVPSFASLFHGHTLPVGDDTVPLSDYLVSDSDDNYLSGPADLHVLNVPSRHRPTTVYANPASLQQADYLAAQVGPDDLILVDADTPLLHQYNGPSDLFSVASLAAEAELSGWLVENVTGHDSVWLVASAGASPITAANVRGQLRAVATPVSTTTVASATIVRFIPRPTDGPGAPAMPYRATFSGGPTLVDAAWSETAAWPDPLEVTLRWRAPTRIPADSLTVIHLRDAAGHSWTARESPVRNDVNFPTSAWAPDEWSDAAYRLRLPPGIPPDRYSVEVSLYNLASGATLGATGPDGGFLGTRVPLGTVAVMAPTGFPDLAEFQIARRLDVPAGALGLIGLGEVSEKILSGEFLSLELVWQAEATPQHDYRARWRLLGPGGEIAHEEVFPLSPHSTSLWRPGDRYRSHYGLHIPPDVAGGQYRLTLNTLDDSGAQVWQPDTSLATIEIVPRERTFTLPDIPHPLDVQFGETIHLRGHSRLPAQVVPGGDIPLTLYLQADGPTDRSYTLFVHLLGPDSQLSGQVDLIPGNGTAPTTSWARGQVIVQEISLPAPPEARTGMYAVAVGFYDAAYGQRLSASGAAENLLSQNRAILTETISIRP